MVDQSERDRIVFVLDKIEQAETVGDIELRSELIVGFIRSESERTRKQIAMLSNLPVEAVVLLADDESYWVRKTLGLYADFLPVSVMEKFAVDLDTGLRESVGKQMNAPEHLLSKLAGDDDSGVRGLVASNPNCPVASLRVLAADSSSHIRYLVAHNERTPADVIETLSHDEMVSVRAGVAGNVHAHPESIRRICQEDVTGTMLYTAALNPSTPPDLLDEISSLSDSLFAIDLSNLLVGNPSTPVSALKRIFISKKTLADVRETTYARLMKEVPELEGFPREWLEQIFRESQHPGDDGRVP